MREKKYGIRIEYIGETSLISNERGLKHIEDIEMMKEGSHIALHLAEDHPGVSPRKSFCIKVIKGHKSAFTRQIQEVLLINNFDGDKLLNGKEKWNICVLPDISIDFSRRRE